MDVDLLDKMLLNTKTIIQVVICLTENKYVQAGISIKNSNVFLIELSGRHPICGDEIDTSIQSHATL